jgi:peptidoglycan/xylan/chitin deacetylase (PgdA/CDA1 family)
MTRGVLVCVLLVALHAGAVAQSLSLTFDDGVDPTTNREAKTINGRILEALKAQRVEAMVFPAVSRIGVEAGLGLIADWAAQGHAVGNHTWFHRSLSSHKVTLDEFTRDVEAADTVLRRLPGFRPMLRFPFLKEGDTVEKRDGMREWLRAHSYRAAPVSIDTSDWYYNQAYLALRSAEAPDKLPRLRQAYVAHLLDRADYYDRLARDVLQRSPAHVLLLHVNALNADALPQVVQAFRERGWRFVSPLAAFADPLYSVQADTLPAGESIVWALTRSRGAEGLRYPAEDSVYEEPILRALGLAPSARN